MTALSLLHEYNEESYVNYISVEVLRYGHCSESFLCCLLAPEGNRELRSLASEVSLILCASNCSGESSNGMLIGRLFVQLFEGFSAVLSYL
jgi:hypothetical protein